MVEELTVEQRLLKLELQLLEATKANKNQNNVHSTLPRPERGAKGSTGSSSNQRKYGMTSSVNETRGRSISPKKSKAPPKPGGEDREKGNRKKNMRKQTPP